MTYPRTLSLASLALIASTSACDLGLKNLGTEDTDGAADTGTDGDEPCEPGDDKRAPDGCNTCTCSASGEWACTELGCEGTAGGECQDGDVLPPGPDNCVECTCNDGMWQCPEIGCETDGDTEGPGMSGDPFDGPEIEQCAEDTPRDVVSIEAVELAGDTLTIELDHSGGCGPNLLGLCHGGFAESDPVQIQAYVAHESQDPCETVESETLTFDLVPLRQAYVEAYRSETGTISIGLDGWTSRIDYSF
jgi:Pacifastin inhibitor (LCMII)